MGAFFIFFLSPPFLSIISSLFVLLVFLQVSSGKSDDVRFTSCAPPFDCGSLKNISYPFWKDGRPKYCGNDYEGYKLKCVENQHPVITISSQDFHLLHLYQPRGMMTIQRLQFGENITCPKEILTGGVFNYADTAVNITLSYGCPNWRLAKNYTLTCKSEQGIEASARFFENHENRLDCFKEVEVPVEQKALEELRLGNTTLSKTLVEPFDIKYFAWDDYCRQCKQSGGRCGSNENSPQIFACYCPDYPHQILCKHGTPVSYF